MKPDSSQKWDIGVLHGFRAIMVLLVANFHIWQQGWLGQTFRIGPVTIEMDFLTRSSYLFVDGMILLSGFLLFLPYARAMDEEYPLPKPGDFYLARPAGTEGGLGPSTMGFTAHPAND